MKLVNRFFSVLTAVVMCLSLGFSTYAADLTSADIGNDISQKELVYEVSYLVNDCGVSVLNPDISSGKPLSLTSSISGYAQKTVSGGSQYIIIPCTSSGIVGMGITIKTSCSSGTYTVNYSGCCQPGDGTASTIKGSMTTNSEKQINNLYQFGDVSEYYILLSTSSDTPSYTVTVWIYG